MKVKLNETTIIDGFKYHKGDVAEMDEGMFTHLKSNGIKVEAVKNEEVKVEEPAKEKLYKRKNINGNN